VLLQGDGGVVDSVSFSPNGLRLVSGSRDGSLRVWDLHHPGAPPTLLQGHAGEIRLVAFAPDSVHLASAGTDGTVRLWSIWSAMADSLCTRVSRNLSNNEWLQYVGEGIPYERTCPALAPGVGAPGAPK
jgi:WD40 repeat protein